jgi:hypothetical protein
MLPLPIPWGLTTIPHRSAAETVRVFHVEYFLVCGPAFLFLFRGCRLCHRHADGGFVEPGAGSGHGPDPGADPAGRDDRIRDRAHRVGSNGPAAARASGQRARTGHAPHPDAESDSVLCLRADRLEGAPARTGRFGADVRGSLVRLVADSAAPDPGPALLDRAPGGRQYRRRHHGH